MVVLSQGHRRRRPSALRHCRYPVRIWWTGGWPGHAADASGDERSVARHAQVPSRGHRNAVDVPSGGPHAPGVDHARLASYRPSMSATRHAPATTAADGRLRRGPLWSPPRPSSPSARGAPRRARGATPPGSCRSRRGRRRGIPVVSQPTLESGAVESRVPLRVRGLTLVDDYVDPPLVQRRVQLRTVASRQAVLRPRPAVHLARRAARRLRRWSGVDARLGRGRSRAASAARHSGSHWMVA